jgi:5'-deoxynucleotidase YfbR-like HD superfamily hydrolase
VEQLRMTDYFKHFIGRDDALRKVTRYSLKEIMLYRTDLYTHSHRTAALVRAMNPIAAAVFGESYDPIKAELMALVHDDAEIIFGDVQAGNKSKMTTAQLAEVRKAEANAIDEIVRRFPRQVAGYSYEQLLRDYAGYTSLEAQAVCYADKYDGMGEALHEVHGGNPYFANGTVNEYGKIPDPVNFYAAIFQNFGSQFPAMEPLLATQFAMFEPMPLKDRREVAEAGKLHTADSLAAPTGDWHYDTWMRIVLADTNDEVCQALYTQKERLPNEPSQ